MVEVLSCVPEGTIRRPRQQSGISVLMRFNDLLIVFCLLVIIIILVLRQVEKSFLDVMIHVGLSWT